MSGEIDKKSQATHSHNGEGGTDVDTQTYTTVHFQREERQEQSPGRWRPRIRHLVPGCLMVWDAWEKREEQKYLDSVSERKLNEFTK